MCTAATGPSGAGYAPTGFWLDQCSAASTCLVCVSIYFNSTIIFRFNFAQCFHIFARTQILQLKSDLKEATRSFCSFTFLFSARIALPYNIIFMTKHHVVTHGFYMFSVSEIRQLLSTDQEAESKSVYAPSHHHFLVNFKLYFLNALLFFMFISYSFHRRSYSSGRSGGLATSSCQRGEILSEHYLSLVRYVPKRPLLKWNSSMHWCHFTEYFRTLQNPWCQRFEKPGTLRLHKLNHKYL